MMRVHGHFTKQNICKAKRSAFSTATHHIIFCNLHSEDISMPRNIFRSFFPVSPYKVDKLKNPELLETSDLLSQSIRTGPMLKPENPEIKRFGNHFD